MKIVASMSLAGVLFFTASAAHAQAFSFSTGNPDGRLGSASNPGAVGVLERETADDFILDQATRLNTASFFGLLPVGFTAADITALDVEIYRVFPFDSDVNRTSGSPLFSTTNVPTRVNSPSDVAFAVRSAGSDLTFTSTFLGPFTVFNSVINGINPKPGNETGGEGAVSGVEVRFDVTFTDPIDLLDGHYFFVPQVGTSGGAFPFLWLSAARPTNPPFSPDLQSWIRDENLDPDWLRIGTDIVGGTTYNAAFSVAGSTITTPEPSTFVLLSGGFAVLGVAVRKRRRNV